MKAKCFANTKVITTENLIAALVFMFDANVVRVLEQGNAEVILIISAPVAQETILLALNQDIVPRPAGVAYTQVSFASGDGLDFAFEGFVGGSTFGTISDPTVGGQFIEL